MKDRTFIIILVMSLALLSITPAGAATITVNTFDDVVSDDGYCSLREAVISVNTGIASGASGGECPAGSAGDTIALGAGEYLLSIGGINENAATTGDLDILNSVTIEGVGSGLSIVNADSIDRVFHIYNSVAVPEPSVMFNGIAITNGSAISSHGGGIYTVFSALTVKNSTISGNSCTVSGGGVYVNIGSTANISNTTISGNSGDTGGGVYVNTGGTANITNSTISGNPGQSGGGANVYGGTANIANSTISGNSAGYGGGVYAQYSGTVNIIGSLVNGNSVSMYGGGVYSISSATVNIIGSLVNGNSAAFGGGVSSATTGTANISNSTINGNSAVSSGGGVYLLIGTANISSSTLSGNSANIGGGVRAETGSTINIGGSILSGNSAPTSGPECSGSPTSLGYNIANDLSSGGCTFGATGDQTGVDPMIGPLQDNGGQTLTHALLPGSPAIDAGDPACSGTDQRGFPRPLDGDDDGNAICDIGAYETAGAAYAQVEQDTIALGSIQSGGATGPTEVKINNLGYAELDILTMYLVGPDASDFAFDVNGGSSPCGSTSPAISSGGFCTVTVSFSPSETGDKEAELIILSATATSPNIAISLSGTSTAGPVPAISLSANSIGFGTVNTTGSTDKTLTFTNNGTGDLTFGIINGSDPLGPPFSIVGDTCSGQNIAASDTCSVTVRFDPSTATASAASIGGLGVIMLGMVFASSTTRRRKALAVLLVIALLAMGLLAACGGGDDTTVVQGKSTYSDTFNVPSNDPDTPNITVNVSGSF